MLNWINCLTFHTFVRISRCRHLISTNMSFYPTCYSLLVHHGSRIWQNINCIYLSVGFMWSCIIMCDWKLVWDHELTLCSEVVHRKADAREKKIQMTERRLFSLHFHRLFCMWKYVTCRRFVFMRLHQVA